MTENTPKPCKFCDKPIYWTNEEGKSVPHNIDGTPHNKKNGSCKKEEVPETKTGRLKTYNSGSATFVLNGGGNKTYALYPTTFQKWQEAGFPTTTGSNPEMWISFSLDKNSFIQPDYQVVPKPCDWVESDAAPIIPFKPASQIPRDPEYAEKTARDILQENLDAKKAELFNVCPECKKPMNWEQFKEVWICHEHGVFYEAENPWNPPTQEIVIKEGSETVTLKQEPIGFHGDSVTISSQTPEDRIRNAMKMIVPSERVGYRISLAGCVNSVIESYKLSIHDDGLNMERIKKEAIELFLWMDGLTTQNLEEKKGSV